MTFVPRNRLSWSPGMPKALSIGFLLGHFLECCAGLCAALYAAKPVQLNHFLDLKAVEVNHDCTLAEARERTTVYQAHVREGFNLLDDADLSINVPTVFVPSGELLLTLLLGNLEHIINHKHQLFMYLRLMGANVTSKDLYHFRG
jgi:hypothetical protein